MRFTDKHLTVSTQAVLATTTEFSTVLLVIQLMILLLHHFAGK